MPSSPRHSRTKVRSRVNFHLDVGFHPSVSAGPFSSTRDTSSTSALFNGLSVYVSLSRHSQSIFVKFGFSCCTWRHSSSHHQRTCVDSKFTSDVAGLCIHVRGSLGRAADFNDGIANPLFVLVVCAGHFRCVLLSISCHGVRCRVRRSRRNHRLLHAGRFAPCIARQHGRWASRAWR